MESLRIKGIRSISDSGDIKLKPITVAIGRNSCGKSTFVRFLPLLKQSFKNQISDSLLFYGDFVDFGQYEDILPNYNRNIKPSFSLKFELSLDHMLYLMNTERTPRTKICSVNITCEMQKKYFSKINIKFFDQNIDLQLSPNNEVDKISINGYEKFPNINDYRWYTGFNGLFPIIIDNSSKMNSYRPLIFENASCDEEISSIITEIIEEHSEPNQSKKILSNKDILDSFKTELCQIRSLIDLHYFLVGYREIEPISDHFNNCELDDELFLKLNALIVTQYLPLFILTINNSITEDMENVHYLKPIRANVNRYYRVQGINVDEVDSDGSNVPMMLYNLNKKTLKDFEAWCKDNLGIEFSVSDGGGHVSLIVKDENGHCTNLADTGYGYSQILPIIVELWLFANGKKKHMNRTHHTIVIEQPELHLHPAFQAKIVDLFVSIINQAKESNIDLKIIFETHSETMINELGFLVNKKEISNQDVNILSFEKNANVTSIKQLNYDERGLIEDWPIGFFSSVN